MTQPLPPLMHLQCIHSGGVHGVPALRQRSVMRKHQHALTGCVSKHAPAPLHMCAPVYTVRVYRARGVPLCGGVHVPVCGGVCV